MNYKCVSCKESPDLLIRISPEKYIGNIKISNAKHICPVPYDSAIHSHFDLYEKELKFIYEKKLFVPSFVCFEGLKKKKEKRNYSKS